MKVTEVRISKLENPSGSLRAFASVTLDDMVAIHGIRVVEGSNGMFLGFPDRKRKDGRFVSIVHPINNEAREEIVNAVLSKYAEA